MPVGREISKRQVNWQHERSLRVQRGLMTIRKCFCPETTKKSVSFPKLRRYIQPAEHAIRGWSLDILRTPYASAFVLRWWSLIGPPATPLAVIDGSQDDGCTELHVYMYEADSVALAYCPSQSNVIRHAFVYWYCWARKAILRARH